MQRRSFLRTSFGAALAAALPSLAAAGRAPRILLRSSWQTVNIGDIAHTPGVLRLLQEEIPEAEIALYPGDVGHGVKELLLANFPKLKIVREAEAIQQAFAENDFFLHGSGPGLVGEESLARWAKETGKPYGVYGITFASKEPAVIELLSKARFVYFRDSVSLQHARDQGMRCPIMEFSPDGAFATRLRNEAAAEAFLKAHGLEAGQFLCCIPRYRITPYWTIPSKKRPFDAKASARNDAMKEHDLAPLREAIVAVVKETKLKVLVCPEDETQMAIGKEMLIDKLPAEVMDRVVWRENYWLTDEALSTYVRSAGLFGCEMHSPIMCIGNGIPAIVCRWKEQTSKGFMWRDIGLGEWLFDLDVEGDLPKVAPAVLAMAKDPAAAKAKAEKARAFVEQRLRATMAVVKQNAQPA